MRRVKIFGLALVAVLALSGMAAGGAFAAKTLILSNTEGPLAVRAPIELSATDLKLETGDGTIECPTANLDGSLETNSESIDSIRFPEGQVARGCSNDGAGTNNWIQFFEPPEGTPPTVSEDFKSSGTTQVTSTEALGLGVYFANTGGSCFFDAKGFKGGFNLGTEGTPEPVTVTWSSTKLTLDPRWVGDPHCPSSVNKATLDPHWKMTSRGVPVRDRKVTKVLEIKESTGLYPTPSTPLSIELIWYNYPYSWECYEGLLGQRFQQLASLNTNGAVKDELDLIAPQETECENAAHDVVYGEGGVTSPIVFEVNGTISTTVTLPAVYPAPYASCVWSGKVSGTFPFGGYNLESGIEMSGDLTGTGCPQKKETVEGVIEGLWGPSFSYLEAEVL